MASEVRRQAPPDPVNVEGSKFRPDYADSFVVDGVDQRSAESWARGTLEECPTALRWLITFGWRYVLGLRLHRGRSPQFVAGWPIVQRVPALIVLEVDSRVLGRARLTFTCSDSSASASSNIEFGRRGARAIWAVVGLLHRRILPYALDHTATHP